MRGIEQYLQVDAATLGALKYAGTWNASTNTPTLASGVGTQGQYYVVSVAGSTNLDGETNWQVGDWAVFNGSVWQKVDGGSTGLLSTLTVTGNTYLATTSGNVGVGTSSPASRLHIKNGAAGSDNIRLENNNGTRTYGIVNGLGSSTDGVFSIYDYTASASRLAITSAGDVGIGTSSPDAKLRVNGTAKIGEGAASNTSKLMVNTVSGVAAGIQLFQDANESWIIQNPASTTALTFANSGTERMRITAAGDVGIGTTSPGSKLEVVGAGVFKLDGAGSTTPLILRNNNTTSTQLVKIGFDSSGAIKASINAAVYGNDYMTFNVGSDTERMRIDASGNLGVGSTSISPAYGYTRVIEVAGQFPGIKFSPSGASTFGFQIGAGTNGFQFYDVAASTERMRIDTSGNLGLGVTPQAWGVNHRVIELAGASSAHVVAYVNGLSSGTNYYINSGGLPTYSYTGQNATRYFQTVSGQHQWFNAASGTAGNTISFTQAMTLDASGDFIVGGTTTNGIRLTVEKSNPTRGIIAHVINSGSSGLTGSQLMFTQNTVNNWVVGQPAGVDAFAFWSGRNTAADGTERMRIDSSGSLLVGKTSASVGTDGAQFLTTGFSGVSAAGTTAFFLNRNTSDGTILEFGRNGVSAATMGVTSSALTIGTGGSERLRITSAGNIHTPAGATTMTNGFFYIPAAAGVPTGVPTAITGTVPMYYDTTNNKFYVYNGAWKSVALL